MTYEPLHHKYRPQTFADLVGQEAIATTLSNALTSRRIAPAYLFSGPRGTGKTSSARILAKSLNCLSSDRPTPHPCGKCEVCQGIVRGSALDVIEIDAASNTGVDNIREIIERAQFAPVQCRYKVYVIDECHMLSQAAFNALLKTLEEPPSHVIFVLATTDPQRVLPTIISRCQRFDYRRIPLEAMVAHLSQIAQKEAIDITEAAVVLIGQLANGGLRDAESLLDQLSLLSGTVTPDRVWDLVGAVPERELLELLQAIRGDLAEVVIAQCRRLLDRGREPLVVLQNLAGAYLNLLLAKTAPDRSELAAVTASTWVDLCQEAASWSLNNILKGQQHLRDSEVQIKNTTQPRLWLEVTLMGLLPALEAKSQKSEIRIQDSEVRSQKSEVSSQQPTVRTDLKPEISLPTERSTPPSSATSQIWEAVLQRLSLLTQSLIQHHCYLLHLDENVARIGIKTEPLLKHAQTKIGELESAFQSVLSRSIQVRIQIASSADLLSEIQDENGREKIVEEQVNISSSSEQTRERLKRDSVTIDKQPIKSINQHLEISEKEHLIISEDQQEASSTSGFMPSQLNVIEPDYSVTEINKAAEIIAKAFDGEIIDLNHQINPTNSAVTPESVTSSTLAVEPESDRSSEAPPIAPPPTAKLMVKGRPNLSKIDEEDDIPF